MQHLSQIKLAIACNMIGVESEKLTFFPDTTPEKQTPMLPRMSISAKCRLSACLVKCIVDALNISLGSNASREASACTSNPTQHEHIGF